MKVTMGDCAKLSEKDLSCGIPQPVSGTYLCRVLRVSPVLRVSLSMMSTLVLTRIDKERARFLVSTRYQGRGPLIQGLGWKYL